MGVFEVHVVKAGQSITVDTDPMSDDVLREIYGHGLKVLVNRGTTKITKETYPDDTQRAAEAMRVAHEQVDNLLAGKVKKTAERKAKGAGDGKVMTEARRIARNIIKDIMKAQGLKVSQYDASEITKAANAYLEKNPEVVEEAKASLERHAKPAQSDLPVDIAPSEKKKAEQAKRKAEKAAQLSAKQAGLPKTGKAEAHVAH
jgi:hypothetical protein